MDARKLPGTALRWLAKYWRTVLSGGFFLLLVVLTLKDLWAPDIKVAGIKLKSLLPWLYIIAVGILTFFVGYDDVFGFRRRRLLQQALEMFERKNEELQGKYPDWEDRFSDCSRDCALVRMLVPPRTGGPLAEVAIAARVTGEADLRSITQLIKRIREIDRWFVPSGVAAESRGMCLYTSFEGSTFTLGSGLAKIVQKLAGQVAGNWFFAPVLQIPGRIKVALRSSSHLLLSPDGAGDRWQSYERAPAARSTLSNAFESLEEQKKHLPTIISPNQLRHFGVINHRVNRSHLEDFGTRGFHFGTHSDLLTRSAREMLESEPIWVYQQHEDSEFLELMKYLLESRCQVTACWPLLENSLRYVTSDHIGEWQQTLNAAVKQKRADVQRYLMVVVGGFPHSIEASTFLTEIPLRRRRDGKYSPVPMAYDQIVECVIGKYFWEAIQDETYSLYIVPVSERGDEKKQTVNEYVLNLQKAQKISDSSAEKVRAEFFRDWIMVKKWEPTPAMLVLQFDEPLPMVKCAAWKREADVKAPCEIAPYYRNLALLVHRYAVSRSTAGDPLPEGPLSTFSYLRDSMEKEVAAKSPFAPRQFRPERDDVLPAVGARIRSQLATDPDYYKGDWEVLLEKVRQRG